MKTRKLLSILLALMMMLSVVPFYASAADLITPQVTVIPTATEIANAGDRIRTSTLSGGVAIDPTTREELEGKWAWSSSGTKVTESGYYEAYFKATDTEKYDPVFFTVYVRIAGDTSDVNFETIIDEAPIITNTLMYGDDWSKLEFTGGKAVNANGEEIAGLFTYSLSGTVSSAGTRSIEFLFTPTDENYATATVKVNYTVAPMPISFGEDHKGTSIDDPFVYEVNPGTLMRDVLNGVKKYINYPPQSVFIIEDANYAAQNGRTYKITVIHDNPNYVGSEVYVTVAFKTVELTPTFKPGYLSSAIDCGNYRPQGTFTVTLDGKEIATVKANEEFTYTAEKSGEYVLGAKYNPVENDYFIVADATQTVDVKLKRLVNRINCTSNGGLFVTYGDTVELSANATIETLDRWVITDESGNEVDLGIDLTQLNITFTMPDFNITAEAKLRGASSGDDTDEPSGGLDDIFGDLTEGDSDNPIINFFNNIIAWFRNLIETIKNFFRGIGNVS